MTCEKLPELLCRLKLLSGGGGGGNSSESTRGSEVRELVDPGGV